MNAQDDLGTYYGDSYGNALTTAVTSDSDASIVYSWSGADITSFIIKEYTFDATSTNYTDRYTNSEKWIKIYTSPDNATWTQLTVAEGSDFLAEGEVGLNSYQASASTGWVEHLFWSDCVTPGTKYLKVEFSKSYDYIKSI